MKMMTSIKKDARDAFKPYEDELIDEMKTKVEQILYQYVKNESHTSWKHQTQ